MFEDKLSIIIPTKNEEKNIRDIIAKCKRYSDDIIVIDAHSEDKTQDLAKSLNTEVYLDNRKGKGEAMRLGILKAKKDIIVFIDADGSHDPDDIPKIVSPILEGKADHVSTSRMKGGSDELHGDMGKFIRMIGSDIITMGINYRFGADLTDSQNGFRAIKREVAKKLDLKENITTIEQEMIIKTLKKGYRMVEVPSHEYARKYGSSRITISKVWIRYLYSWIKYLFFG